MKGDSERYTIDEGRIVSEIIDGEAVVTGVCSFIPLLIVSLPRFVFLSQQMRFWVVVIAAVISVS